MSDTIPNTAHAMIIGAMKCGTSSLYDYLAGHPEICPAKTKEPEFFSENQSHGMPVTQYSDLFEFDITQHKYTLDGSTGYTKYPLEPNVAQNISNYGIVPKLIYIIRNPLDRIESHFNFMRRNEKWSLDMIEGHLIDTCNYHLQLEQYTKYFNRENILILDFDDLKKDPKSLLKETYAFLGLDDSHYPENYVVRNQTRAISKTERAVKKMGLGPFFKNLPAPIKNTAKSFVTNILRPQKRKLTDEEKKQVIEKLSADMKKFKEIYHFDVSKWGF